MNNSNYFDAYYIDEIENINYDPSLSRLSFIIVRTTYKPKIMRYVQQNYQKVPVYSDIPSIRKKVEYKFDRKINIPLFCEQQILNLPIKRVFMYKICNHLSYRPNWLIIEYQIFQLIETNDSISKEIKSLKYEDYPIFKRTNYKTTPSKHFIRILFVIPTLGLSYLGFISKKRAKKNELLNNENNQWNQKEKNKVDENNQKIHQRKECLSNEVLENNKRIELLKKEQQQQPIENILNDHWINIKEALKFENKTINGKKGVYIIWNKTKNKFYVGQSKDLFKRIFRCHFNISTYDVNNIIFAKDWYDGDEFYYKYIICSTKDELDKLERENIEKYDSFYNGYNKTSGNK